MTAPEPMLDVNEVAARLGVSKMTVYRLATAGELRAFRIGRSVRIRPRDLAEYLRAANMGGRP